MSQIFRKFKNRDFDFCDKTCSGRLPTISDTELQELLDQDSTQTQQLAEKLDVTQKAISKILHALGKVKKKGKSVPHELTTVQRVKYE